PGRDEPLGLGREVRQLPRALPIELRAEEAELVALRIYGNVAERIALDHLLELLGRADDHVDLEAEPLGDLLLELGLELFGWFVAREHHVAALHVRPYIIEPGGAEQLA